MGLLGTTPGTTADRLGRAPSRWVSARGLPRPAAEAPVVLAARCEHSTPHLFGSGVGMTVLTALAMGAGLGTTPNKERELRPGSSLLLAQDDSLDGAMSVLIPPPEAVFRSRSLCLTE